MRPFDLVLTPNWQWHDHGNTSDAPMIWLDGLDIPMVRFSRRVSPSACRKTRIPRRRRPAIRSRAMAATCGPSQAPPPRAGRPPPPLFHYPFADWRAALTAIAAHDAPDPHLGHALEFTNPADGGPVMPTIAAHVRLLPQGFTTRPRQSTDGTIFVVVSGGARRASRARISR